MITTTALANLLVAVTSGKLPNVCVVMTDLRGTSYGLGSNAVNEALVNLERETQRSVTRIDPVQLASDELYHILRTRLFEMLPDGAGIEAVAAAYAEAIADANKVDLTKESAAQMHQSIMASYPFHPAIRDLYARFRDNTGFQQTRALIRIMRAVVARLWADGGAGAKRRYLIGAQDLDFLSSDITSEIRNINGSFENAVAHDISDTGSKAVAQQIDAETSGTDARDAATLIFLSSLSQAVDPTLGLDRGELVGMLAAPHHDLGALNAAVDLLQRRTWYLHASASGKLFFRNVENINARLENYAQQAMNDARETTLRERLDTMFKPITQAVYQSVESLPALNAVTLVQNKTTLVIFRPAATALDEIKDFYEHQQWKNRVLFLTGDLAGYHRVLEAAAYLRAIEIIIAEFRSKNVAETDSQLITAREMQSKIEGQFYIACRETFQSLYYPSKNGLVPLDVECVYAGNKFEAEAQITNALKGVYKYIDLINADTNFPKMIESRLWPATAKEVAWSQIVQSAATNPAWDWHHVRALDEVRDEQVQRGLWRDLGGGFYEKGPFPPPRTDVSVQEQGRDVQTGTVTLRIKPLHADAIHYAEDGAVASDSPRRAGQDLTTTALTVQFLAVDSTGEHAIGEVRTWRNTITVRHKLYDGGGGRMCALEALPRGAIRYTTDGSSPANSGVAYTEPFAVPPNATVVLALAEEGGIASGTQRFDVPKNGAGGGTTFDLYKPATYRQHFKSDATGDTYTFLDRAQKRGAKLAGVVVNIGKDSGKGVRWLELRGDDNLYLDAETVRTHAQTLAPLIPGGTITFEAEIMQTPSGQDLMDLIEDMKGQLDLSKVEQ